MKSKLIIFLAFFHFTSLLYAQSPSFSIIPNEDTICINLGDNYPLSFSLDNYTPTAPNQMYSIENIPFVPEQIIGTQVTLTDDSYSSALNIGFDFCFYGTKYTQFFIGSNGLISFNGQNINTYIPQLIPSEMALSKVIMPAWGDWNPGIGGIVSYQTIGDEPIRKLVVQWFEVPLFSCTSLKGTFQIVLEEGTNNIVFHTTNKPVCSNWASGKTTQGIYNNQQQFKVVQNRNSSVWTAENESVRFNSGSFNLTPSWKINNIPAGNNNSIIAFVTNGNPIRKYKVSLVNQCTNEIYEDSVIVALDINQVNVSHPSNLCDTSEVAVLNINDPSNLFVEYTWNFNDAIVLNDSIASTFGTYHLKWTSFGDKTITIQAKTICGRIINQTVHINITAWPQPSLAYNETSNLLEASNGMYYLWYLNNVQIMGMSESQTHVPTSSGYYKALVFYNNNCFYFTDSIYIDFLSVSSIIENNFLIYPNPIKNIFKIRENQHFNQLIICDALGRTVFHSFNEQSNNLTEWNISHLSNGIYFIQLKNDNQIIGYQKLIKQ